MLFTTVLIFLACAATSLSTFIGIDNAERPIVVSALIGAILGDLETGVMCGATIELVWLGVFAIGASNPPDMLSGAVIGTAYVITADAPVESAVLLAVPVATVVKLLNDLRWTVINPTIGGVADKYAAKGDVKGVIRMHYLSACINIFGKATIIAAGFYFGIPVIETIVDSIPQFLSDGLSYATGIIPAIGFAMIARMILTKDTVMFLFLGFLLASFFGQSIISIAGLGCIIVAYQYFAKKRQEKEVMGDDNEF